jgi:2-alkyl-3-oxoalkanoate reductase
MSGRALVTGATGMLGSHIVERLLASGWSVRALLRGPTTAAESHEWLSAEGVECVLGSLEDPASLVVAGHRCDAVFHAAAAIGSGRKASAFFRTNVQGTANVIAAAAVAGARLVHVSSTAVHGSARYRGEPTDESAPPPDLPEHDVYGRSKRDAEALVLDAHRRGRIWATIVRPPVMYGRRDRQFAPRIGPLLERGVFPRIAGGGATLSLAHVGSVADGAILAARSDVAGGRIYLLVDDHPVTVSDLIRYAAEGLERVIWAPSVPAWLGRAGFGTLAWALRAGGRADLARHAAGTLAMLTRNNPFTSERARLELGWAPAACAEHLVADAFRWWKAHRADLPRAG